ncbi:hypothetical protein Pan44_47690 [Caulifigura coniformis]|uniref:Uncharacterized protein n=1 Tax=Caulifigura coniformis TaxID=2527983 RepID=A0A517SKQ8_9PLAN|nr:PrgI family protein [Caulifigura coniformis]QDT56712.1 hypothetical protein Pan44_47690 [Caulifigura coniformis]
MIQWKGQTPKWLTEEPGSLAWLGGMSFAQLAILGGGMLVVVLVWAGALSTILLALGVANKLALVISLIAAAALFAGVWWRKQPASLPIFPAGRVDPAASTTECEVTEIVEISEVTDLDDFGPGFVFRTTSGDSLFICGPEIEELGGKVATTSLRVVVSTLSPDVVSIEVTGSPLAVSSDVELETLPLKWWCSFWVFRDDG